MPTISDAPKRIWATEDAENYGEDRFHSTTPFARGSEYILAAEHDRIVAEKNAEIARLRHGIHEASDPDFLFGAMDNVNDMGVSVADFADAASRAIRAALENRNDIQPAV